MSGDFFYIHWDALENFFYWPIFFVGLFFLLMRLKKIERSLNRLVEYKWRHIFLTNISKRKNFFKLILILTGLLCLLLALLKPQWNKKEDVVEQEGRDVLIALDISRSMLAKDEKPNRLEFAKGKIKKLLNLLPCDRVGLILFSGSAIAQCPLTSDFALFNMFLDQVDAETISLGTTAMDQAINKALELFKGMPDKKNRILILFTDGEDFSSNLRQIKREVLKEGMNIFTIGIGSEEGAPVPELDNEGNVIGSQKDAKGKVVISRLNSGILKNLAEDSGGKYINAAVDNSDLNSLSAMIKKFEKEKFEDRRINSFDEQYPYFLLISLLCFGIEWLL